MRKPNNNRHNSQYNRQYLTDRQFKKALQTYDTRGHVDLLGERAFMYASEAHPDTDEHFGETLVFEIKHMETTQIRGRARTNIIVTNKIYQ